MIGLLIRVFVVLFLTMMSVQAATQNIDLTKLSPDVAKALVEDLQKKKKDLVPAVTPNDARDWAGVGKEIALAISETAKALSIEVNQFVQTPVGWWAMFFLFWSLLGAKLVKITIGSTFFIIGAIVWWKSLKHFYWGDFKFYNTDSQIWCSICHALGAFALVVLIYIITFGVL